VVGGDVYRRAPAPVDEAALAALRSASERPGLAVTVSSGEVLGAFLEAASTAGIAHLHDAALVVPGERVAALAGEHGWRGPLIVAGSAEDEGMLAALARYAARSGPGTGA
jgi:uroporphyrinogen-III synthase